MDLPIYYWMDLKMDGVNSRFTRLETLLCFNAEIMCILCTENSILFLTIFLDVVIDSTSCAMFGSLQKQLKFQLIKWFSLHVLRTSTPCSLVLKKVARSASSFRELILMPFSCSLNMSTPPKCM